MPSTDQYQVEFQNNIVKDTFKAHNHKNLDDFTKTVVEQLGKISSKELNSLKLRGIKNMTLKMDEWLKV